MKEQVAKWLEEAIAKLQTHHHLPAELAQKPHIERARDAAHGDFTCNIALLLAKIAAKPARELAQLLIDHLPPTPTLEKVEVAGPGFINFYLKQAELLAIIPAILQAKTQFGLHEVGQGVSLHIEYVSANPTGPLHVGHGRSAAYGSCLANLLKAIGYTVHREYYVNDAGRQMNILAVSVWLRYLEMQGVSIDFPKNAYQGEYVKEISARLVEKYQDQWVCPLDKIYAAVPENNEDNKDAHIDALIVNAKTLLGDGYTAIFQQGLTDILADIREDLADFNVHYDEWFSEAALAQQGAVVHSLEVLDQKNWLYEKEGAIWFKSTVFGDDKDRVVKRANGEFTYFAPDIAYHLNKLERGYSRIVDVLGADHHSYVLRIKASVAALTGKEDVLATPLVQFVSLYRGTQKVTMSTRSGSFVTLRELREEVGNDAARYFYIMRKLEQHLDFDLELATAKSSENPVYYIQYAYARICSVFRQLAEAGQSFDEALGLLHLQKLALEQEKSLMTALQKYPDIVLRSAQRYEPHTLAHYLYELANAFHAYYNSSKFLVEEAALCQARLVLIKAAQQVFYNGLTLLGLSVPEKM